MKKVMFCVLLFLSISFVFSVPANAAHEFELLCPESIKTQKKMAVFNADYRKDKIIQKLIYDASNSKDISELTTVFDSFRQKYLIPTTDFGEVEAKRLIAGLNGWAYIYEAILSDCENLSKPGSLIGISNSIVVNLANDRDIITYLEWLEKLSDAYSAAVSICNRDNKSLSRQFKEFGRGLTIIALANKDYWKIKVLPAVALKAMKPYESVMITNAYDEWYLMLKKYVLIQDEYYNMRKDLKKIINRLSQIDAEESNSKARAAKSILQKYDELSSLYFKKLDHLLRLIVVDSPMNSILFYRYLQYVAAKHWVDDKDAMRKAAMEFARVNLFSKTVTVEIQSRLLDWQGQIKAGLSLFPGAGEKEWEQYQTQAKFSSKFWELAPRIRDITPNTKLETQDDY